MKSWVSNEGREGPVRAGLYLNFVNGVNNLRSGNFTEAVKDLEIWVKESTADNLEAYWALSDALIGLENYERAREILLEAHDLDPNDQLTLRKLGDLEEKTGNRAGALDYFQHMIEVGPDNSGAWAKLAQVNIVDNEEESIEYANVAIEKNVFEAMAYLIKLFIYHKRGDDPNCQENLLLFALVINFTDREKEGKFLEDFDNCVYGTFGNISNIDSSGVPEIQSGWTEDHGLSVASKLAREMLKEFSEAELKSKIHQKRQELSEAILEIARKKLDSIPKPPVAVDSQIKVVVENVPFGTGEISSQRFRIGLVNVAGTCLRNVRVTPVQPYLYGAPCSVVLIPMGPADLQPLESFEIANLNVAELMKIHYGKERIEGVELLKSGNNEESAAFMANLPRTEEEVAAKVQSVMMSIAYGDRLNQLIDFDVSFLNTYFNEIVSLEIRNGKPVTVAVAQSEQMKADGED